VSKVNEENVTKFYGCYKFLLVKGQNQRKFGVVRT
jgi:hypothetical protein